MTPTAFVTGCSRGIGLEFVKQLLARKYRVIASCRSPESASALQALRSGNEDTFLGILKLDTASEQSIKECAEKVREITPQISLLINNAGISSKTHPNEAFMEADKQDFMHVFEVNVAGPLVMFQQFKDFLLPDSEYTPKAVTVSSIMGSIAETTSSGLVSYRVSKAAVNMLMKVCSLSIGGDDGQKPIVVNFHPGWVQTDMGGASGRKAHLSPEQSVSSMLDVIGHLAPADNGKFLNYDGAELPW